MYPVHFRRLKITIDARESAVQLILRFGYFRTFYFCIFLRI